MLLKPDLNFCENLLQIYGSHDGSCTDSDPFNCFENGEGLVSCTRCWLLDVIEQGKIPIGAELLLIASVTLPAKNREEMLRQYADLLGVLGAEHPRAQNFLKAKSADKEFLVLAQIVRKLHEAKL